jgi:kynurenine formamidase
MPDASRFVDLSLPIRDGGPSYPGDPICSVVPVKSMPDDDFNLRAISMGSHQGTHLDAPFHFLADGITIDQVPLEQTTGAAILVDLGDRPPRASIEIDDFAGIDLQPGARLVYRLGWDRHVGEAGYFTDMPRLSLAAAAWLAERRLALLGMDSPTPNPDHAVEVHRLILGSGAVLLEGLAGLDQLLAGAFWLHSAPLRIHGSDGAPVRAYGEQRPPR